MLKNTKAKLENIPKAPFENLKDVDWKWNELGAEFYNMGMMVINSKKFLPIRKDKQQNNLYADPEFKDFVDGIGYPKNGQQIRDATKLLGEERKDSYT